MTMQISVHESILVIQNACVPHHGNERLVPAVAVVAVVRVGARVRVVSVVSVVAVVAVAVTVVVTVVVVITSLHHRPHGLLRTAAMEPAAVP
jgi:hypothetical protein